MIRSVRGRLTVAVTITMGAIAVTASLVAPHIVDRALLDDRLDAEAALETEALTTPVRIVTSSSGTLGTPELTALFGPEIADLAARLDEHDALEPIRALRADGLVRVAPSAGIVGTVDATGRVRVDRLEAAELGGPVVSLDRLHELATAIGAAPNTSLDLMEDGSVSFGDFLEQLDEQFGDLLEGRLDPSVFENLPDIRLDDSLIPPELYDMLVDELDDGTMATMPARDIDELAFGVRPVGNVEVIVTTPTDGIDRTVDRVRAALWIAVPLTMLLTGLATWLLAGRALRPVRLITERTSLIRSSTLHDRVPVPAGHDEISGLATEMNTMLDRVQREDTRRRQFVADASHELRSPIAAIRTQAEAALAAPDDTDAAELAAGVLAEAERMGVLVDDLLSLARHDEALAPPGAVVDLDDVVLDEARRPRRVRVDAHKVSAGRVRCRPDELTRVVTHLLDNAARHAESTVAVSLVTTTDEHDDDIVRLTVDDDGPGVPAEDRERIFERFVRLDDARQRDSGGAGLGLAVVATVARSCGGEVSVTDSDLGGARFVLTLPAA
ncbi:MAG TPA: ATP-binding protein [Ilumatobacter sp.]|nr:ATP-binding protein [Ilumatobacter sp.]